jgi:hypothetical protein
MSSNNIKCTTTLKTKNSVVYFKIGNLVDTMKMVRTIYPPCLYPWGMKCGWMLLLARSIVKMLPNL